jgi:transcriptional regulator with XRE-family HTH domain
MDYGKAIKILRAFADLQQRELAQIAGVDASLISMIEKGTRKPSVATLEQITMALEVPQHLFTLLAAEPKDLRAAHPEELQKASESLARILLATPAKRRKKRGRKKAARHLVS